MTSLTLFTMLLESYGARVSGDSSSIALETSSPVKPSASASCLIGIPKFLDALCQSSICWAVGTLEEGAAGVLSSRTSGCSGVTTGSPFLAALTGRPKPSFLFAMRCEKVAAGSPSSEYTNWPLGCLPLGTVLTSFSGETSAPCCWKSMTLPVCFS